MLKVFHCIVNIISNTQAYVANGITRLVHPMSALSVNILFMTLHVLRLSLAFLLFWMKWSLQWLYKYDNKLCNPILTFKSGGKLLQQVYMLLWKRLLCMSLQCDISSLYNVLQILPEKYSYHRRPDQDTNHATDCVICMTGIDLTLRSDDCMVQWWDVLFFLYFIIDSLTSAWCSLLFSLQVTPCDHFFHSGCLQRWMDIKMECPTCRRPLPPAWIVYITYRINWHHPTH